VTRLLVVMGSGETAPTMVKPHRAILARVSGPALVLDTPYGFQSNADDISSRAVTYFATSVGRTVSVLSWRRPPPDALARERAVTALRDAGWVFAGPGSPTYTLRQWHGTPVPGLLVDKLARGGVVVFASAAALTLGSHTVPVYEIYKAGVEPRWEPGLNLVEAALGFPAVVIPHYDNAEGGHHDTRFCYLGEGRLTAMEAMLPAAQSLIIGVDEHTAVLFDLDARTAAVVGNGCLTLRRAGRSAVFPSGAVLTFEEVAAGPSAVAGDPPASAGDADLPAPPGGDGPVRVAQPSLRSAADALDARFAAALAARDVDGCVAAVLELEQALVDWSADTLTSDEGDDARAVFRGMVKLGELARAGARDPREAVAPLVEALLELRAKARSAKDFATSDVVRAHLSTAGIEVRDTPDGATWELS
jgi:cyanophycinase-like exopeptidase